MDPRSPFSRSPFPGGGFASLGAGGPAPPDVLALLLVVFVTFSGQFFASTAGLVALLRLTPGLWQSGTVWQLVTYPFVGIGPPSLWFLLSLFILYLFARTVYYRLGRRSFWRVLVGVSGVSAAAAAVVEIVARGLGGGAPAPFVLMQGQYMLMTVTIAAFATLYRDATILLFFVLPLRAGWFLWLEILFAFMGFLGSKDLPGLVGICVSVGATWWWLDGRRAGGLRVTRLRLRAAWTRLRLGWLRRRRGIRAVGDGRGGGDGGWIHRVRD